MALPSFHRSQANSISSAQYFGREEENGVYIFFDVSFVLSLRLVYSPGCLIATQAAAT
jgi:hypothetical protein